MEGFCRFAGGFCPRWFQYTTGMVSLHCGDGFTTLRGWFYPNSGMVLSQPWEGVFFQLWGGVFFQLWGGVKPRFFPNPRCNPRWVFFQPKVGFFPTQGRFVSSIRMIFLEHGDAIFRAWGCYVLSMGMLFFEHGDAIF